jgi:tRNA dimethylallyltransferase
MIAAGLEEEVRQLLSKGYAPSIKAFQSLGYQQMLGYIRGELTRDEAIRLIKVSTKRYAKRQLTWFRKDPEIQWFTLPGQAAAVEELLRKFLNI